MSKVWLITGSARGLGRSILEAVLETGGSAIAAARNTGALSDLQTRYGERLRPFILDVKDEAGAQAAVDFAVKFFGRLDVLVNNAGYGHAAPFEQTSSVDFRDQVETNLFGVVNLCRAAAPVMRRQRCGYIVNISSVGGRTATPGLSAYQAAKWAVGGFTEVLAQEVAPFGVKVVALEPGGMRTDWGYTACGAAQEILPEYEPSVGTTLQMLRGYAGHEIGDPAKISRVILDLTNRENLPPHLLLGSDALFASGQAEAARQQSADEWEKVSASTDFEGTDLASLGRLLRP